MVFIGHKNFEEDGNGQHPDDAEGKKDQDDPPHDMAGADLLFLLPRTAGPTRRRLAVPTAVACRIHAG